MGVRGASDEVVEAVAPSGYTAPPTVARLYGVDAIEEGATRGRIERFLETGQVRPDEPVASPALLVRAEARRNVQNQATRTAETVRALVDEADFGMDDAGRIARLAGIDETIPGAPTLRDVAARLPVYEPHLTDGQLRALEEIRDSLAPYRQALDEVAQAETSITQKASTLVPGSRPDVMEGGFYIPRGKAETEELADLATKRYKGAGGGRAGREGFEKTAVFGSEAEGIEAGYGYTPVAESIGSYVRGIGNRTLDRHASNYFLSRVDEAGQRIATTPKARVLRRNPALAGEVDALRQDIQNLRSGLGRLTEKEDAALRGFFENPDIEDIEDLRDALNTIVITRGQRAGANIDDLRMALDSAKSRLNEIRPEYQRLLRAETATPRDAGRIPLRGLEAYSFPWEIADEARRVLDAESPRNRGAAVAALNSLLRGIQATGEMSYLGIQGAVSMASGNRAWRRAARAATEAWMNGGENSLGRAMRAFDARAVEAGRPTLDDWAASGLRMGGGRTEFEIGESLGQTAKKWTGAERADRGFGTFGDVARMELADMMAEESVLAGRTLTTQEMKTIAESVNRVTGWTPQRLGGDVGEALNFAPRYFAARLRTLGQLGSKDVRQRQLARRLIGRYIALASTMTIAANYALGEETDFRPFSGKSGPTWNPLEAEYKNPNFMRVRNVGGRDWSLLGPVDATMGAVIGAGSLLTNPTGDPKESLNRMRAVLSVPLVSAGLDWLVFGENFDREKLDNAEALGRDIMKRVVPFAVPELIETGMEAKADVEGGNALDAAAEVGGGVVQGAFGGRGSRLTPAERAQAGEFGDLKGIEQFNAINAETWQVAAQQPALQRMMGDAGTYGQWYQRTYQQVYDAKIAAGKPPMTAADEAQAAVQQHPLYKAYTELRTIYRTNWIKQNPEEAIKFANEQAALPFDEQKWRPTREQRDLMESYLEAVAR
jgi:hypothetical protein